ncbi:MAG: BON domain-containing protein [Deltaproteobacteria bacterium]|nr:BON domain-containing protein [Deltaproteobacteria bacterium]
MTRKDDPVKKIKARLTERAHLDPRKTPVEVRMEGDAVVIEGMVERIAQKKRALLAAMEQDGVRGVVDRLLVRPSSRMTDAEIRDHLNAAFMGEAALKDAGIKVSSERGIVDLEGAVGSLSHKRLAGVLAWWVPGAADVINSLEVTPPEEDSPDELRDALTIILEKDRLVDAAAITVDVNGWVVTLGGAAQSEAEREAAEDDAWYVWGVNDVVNNIRTTAPARPGR